MRAYEDDSFEDSADIRQRTWRTLEKSKKVGPAPEEQYYKPSPLSDTIGRSDYLSSKNNYEMNVNNVEDSSMKETKVKKVLFKYKDGSNNDVKKSRKTRNSNPLLKSNKNKLKMSRVRRSLPDSTKEIEGDGKKVTKPLFKLGEDVSPSDVTVKKKSSGGRRSKRRNPLLKSLRRHRTTKVKRNAPVSSSNQRGRVEREVSGEGRFRKFEKDGDRFRKANADKELFVRIG